MRLAARPSFPSVEVLPMHSEGKFIPSGLGLCLIYSPRCRKPVMLICIAFFALGSTIAACSQNMVRRKKHWRVVCSQCYISQSMMIAARGMLTGLAVHSRPD